MSDFKDMLDELHHLPGVRGAAIATRDGIVAASSLQDRYREDVVVGLASFLVSTTQRAIGTEDAHVSRFRMHCTHGKLILQEIGEAVLIVITDQFVRMEALLTELDDVSRRMRRASRIDV